MRQFQQTPLWLWFNLLSLDAPLVAVVWQDFLARVYPTTLLPAGRWTLGLTVWAIYLADRMLDIHHCPQPLAESAALPHRFYDAHPRFAQWLLGCVVAADALVACCWLRPAVLANGLLLSIAVAVYLSRFARPGAASRWKAPAAASFFSAGVFLVAFTNAPHHNGAFARLAITFAALCLANIALLHRLQRRTTCAITGALAMALIISPAWFGATSWYLAIAISAAGLTFLALWGRLMSWPLRRVLADAVLLSPLLFRFR